MRSNQLSYASISQAAARNKKYYSIESKFVKDNFHPFWNMFFAGCILCSKGGMDMKRKRNRKQRRDLPVSLCVLYGIGIGFIVIFAEALLGGFLLHKERITQEGFPMAVPVFLLLASTVGCLYAGRKSGRKILPVCAVTALGLWLCLLAIPALFFDGMYGRVGICALAIFAGSAAGMWLSTRTHKRKYV